MTNKEGKAIELTSFSENELNVASDEEAQPLRDRTSSNTQSNNIDISTDNYDKTKKDSTSRDSSGVALVVRQDDGVLSAGTVGSSVLNLIAATLGAGTITMPYIICRTGIAFGCILTIMGGFLSYYSSMLLIKCAELTGKRNYEDFAEVAFGSKHWRTVVSVTMMVSLLGFTTAYISLSKTLIPNIVVDTFGRDEKENLSV